jgi:hypothetical protein
LIAGVAALVVGVIAPSEAATAKPDLRISELEFTPVAGTDPDPPHIVLDSKGDGAVRVRVKTKNFGNTAAPASQTAIGIKGFQIAFADVDRLKPGETDTSTATVPGNMTRLGFTTSDACADWGNDVPESNEANNCRKGPLFTIIPKVWKATRFRTTVSGFGGDQVTSSVAMFFRYSGSSQQSDTFVYDVYGAARATNSGTYGGGCAISGSSPLVRNNPWPAPSRLSVDIDLKGYHATATDPNAPPYNATVTCPGGPPFNVPASLQSLDTFIGEGQNPTMSSTTKTLVGSHTEITQGNNETTWSWRFDADVPSS